MNMSISYAQAHFGAPNANQTRIANIDRRLAEIEGRTTEIDGRTAEIDNKMIVKDKQIAALEEEISLHKESKAIMQEMRANNESIITNTEKIIALEQSKMANLIASRDQKLKVVDLSNKAIQLLTESRDIQRNVLVKQEKVVAAQEKVVAAQEKMLVSQEKLLAVIDRENDLRRQMIAVMEKMEAIMMKNPAKYGGLTPQAVQQMPEVLEIRDEAVAVAIAENTLVSYPEAQHPVLTETIRDVVDVTFSRISTTNMEANRRLFSMLEQRIEAAVEKKYESLHNTPLANSTFKSYLALKHLRYMDLAYLNKIKA